MSLYRCVAWWNVQYGVEYNIEAETPEAALATLRQGMMDDVDLDNPNRCFFECSEAFDNSDGDTSLEVWAEGKNEIAAQELCERERLANAGRDMRAALEAILFQVIQGKVLERDACITQARAALAAAKAGA